MRGIPASVTGGATDPKLIYDRLYPSCENKIASASSVLEIQNLLTDFCNELQSQTGDAFIPLISGIRETIPVIAQLQFEKRGDRVHSLHPREIDNALMLVPEELRIAIYQALRKIAPVAPRPEVARFTFDSTGSLGPDLKKLNELKDSGRLSAEQASDLIEGVIAKIDSLDALAQYVGGSEESPFKQPIIKAKSFTTDPSKKLSELQEYLNSLDSSTGNRLLIVRRVKILAVQEWHKRHSIGVEGGKQLDPKLVSEFRSIFDGLRKDSYSPEDITEIVRIIDLLISRLGNSAFSTEELERFKDRFTFFLNKDYTLSYERDVDAPHGFGLGFLFNSIFNYIKLNGLSPEKPNQASIEQRVSSATSINELFTIVRELGTIPSSVGDFS
ncbi:hypothetical protein EBU94_08730, partial [bacterium]|nr:hypothetical protein [bacterium]